MKPSFFVKDKDFYKTLVRLSLPAALQSLISLLVLMADNVMVSRFHAGSSGPGLAGQQRQHLCDGGAVRAGRRRDGADLPVLGQAGHRIRQAGVRGDGLRLPAVRGGDRIGHRAFPPRGDLRGAGPAGGRADPIAISYLRIACLAYLPLALSSALTGCLKGVEVVKMTLYAAVISLLSNVCLNALLIFGLFGLPALGVQGAAIATVAARIIELVVIWVYCFRVQKAISIQPKELLKHESWAWRDYAKFGLPVGLTDAQWALVGLLKMAIIGYLGKIR